MKFLPYIALGFVIHMLWTDPLTVLVVIVWIALAILVWWLLRDIMRHK